MLHLPQTTIKPDAQDGIQGTDVINEKPVDSAKKNHSSAFPSDETQTVEPLGPIVITDPAEMEPAATAGKWPTEAPTVPPYPDNDTDNETRK